MNSVALAQSAYAQAAGIARSDRDTEYRAFAQVTRDLARHAEPSAVTFPRLAEAVHRNGKLWAILAQDVARDGNPLPTQLRAQIFYLAEFTRQHSHKVLTEDAHPGILVEINTAVMRGLRGELAEAQA